MTAELAIMSLSRARAHKREFDAVITIEGTESNRGGCLRFHHEPRPAHLVLRFDDIETKHGSLRMATESDVLRAILFAREQDGKSLLVHCFAGLSRSTAIMLAILSDRLGAGHEAVAFARVLMMQPEAFPNLLVVELADRLLGRGGKLLSCCSTRTLANGLIVTRKRADQAFWFDTKPGEMDVDAE